MDIFSAAWELYIRLIHQIPDTVFSFLLRANLLLLGPIIAAYIGFMQGVRNRKLQIVLMATGALAAISIPLHGLMASRALLPWLFIALLLGCWYLPLVFSFLAHPHRGSQIKITKGTRWAVAVLFLLNLLLCK